MTDCPSLAELADFTRTGDPAVEEHVASCRRCRALLRLLSEREQGSDSELPLRELPQAPPPQREPPMGEITFGEVCIVDTDSSGGTLLVGVILDDGNGTPQTFEVAPVSTETAYASDWDLLLGPDDAPLGYPAMVEVWNHGTILGGQVVERLGLLLIDGQHRLKAMYEALFGDEEPPDDVPRGAAVLSDEDPRAIFQEEEAERVRPFWQPAARAFAEKKQPATASVGMLLDRWLEEQGYGIDDFATDLGWPKQDVVLLRADQFDLQRFPADRLVDALRRTDIPQEELETGLWRTIQRYHFAGPLDVVEQRFAFRRTTRRRGAERGVWSQRRVTAVSLPPEEQELRRKRYINDVLEALEEKRGF